MKQSLAPSTGTRFAALVAIALTSACSRGKAVSPTTAPAATVEHRVSEQDLTRVRLSEAAERRLGIQTGKAETGGAHRVSRIAGDVMLPPGQSLIATAPVSGTVQSVAPAAVPGGMVKKGDLLVTLTPLVSPQRDVAATVEADAGATRARVEAATQQLARARALLVAEAGSQRSVELAEQEFTQAKALADAAADRLARLRAQPLAADVNLRLAAPVSGILRQMQVGTGQTVNAGTVLFEVADVRRVWLRVPVYSADLRALDRSVAVEIRDIDGAGPVRRGRVIAAPPSADPLSQTADLYFELENADGSLHPGQRLTVRVPVAPATVTANGGAPASSVTVPASSIVYDAQGGAWLYVVDAPRVYRRQRIDIQDVSEGLASIARGVAAGTTIVTTGVAELFGTEFGAGK